MASKSFPVSWFQKESLIEEETDFLLMSEEKVSSHAYYEPHPSRFDVCRHYNAVFSNNHSNSFSQRHLRFLKPRSWNLNIFRPENVVNREKSINQWLQTSHVTSSRLDGSQSSLDKFMEVFSNDESSLVSSERFSRTLLMHPFQRKQTHAGFFSAIPLEELDISNPQAFLDSPQNISSYKFRFRKTSSVDSPPHAYQKYFNEGKVDYDSDTGWKAKITGKLEEHEAFEKSREMKLSRESLTLDLKVDEPKKAHSKASNKEAKKSKRNKESISSLVHTVQLKTSSPKNEKASENKENAASRRNVFARCSLNSVGSSKSDNQKNDEEEPEDDVFENKKAPKSSKSHARKRNELEASPIKRNDSLKSQKSQSTPTKNNNSASHNAIAKPKPTRGSLKKSPHQTSNSDYDRDRGRSRHMEGGHRESFKKNERTNEQRDSSERDPKDGSLNRSLSNTDTNLEDRIGKL